jgi:signal peptidase complex subunit 2
MLIYKINFLLKKVKEETETKVEKWDWNAVKNCLDDSARKFITSQANFVEEHSLMNGRLIISTIAVTFSLYGIIYDWLHPFPESRNCLIYCVIFYFISIGVLTLYTTFIEKNCFAVAKQAGENLWKFSSKQKTYIKYIKNKLILESKLIYNYRKCEDVYQLEVELIDVKTNKSRKSNCESSIAKYFDENGVLCTKQFYNDLSKICASLSDDKKSK